MDNNNSESDCIFHEFKFGTMTSRDQVEEFSLFLVVNDTVEQLLSESVQSRLRLEGQLDLLLLLRHDLESSRRMNSNECLRKVSQLLICIESYHHWFLREIGEDNSLCALNTYSHDSKVKILVFGTLQFKLEGDTLALNLNVDFMEAVDVKSKSLFIATTLSRCEDDRYLENIIFLSLDDTLLVLCRLDLEGENYLSWRKVNIQIVCLFI